jgi:hypothetical protein
MVPLRKSLDSGCLTDVSGCNISSMSGPLIDPVSTLATAKTLAELLPPEGRMELMRHLMSLATPQCKARFMAEMPPTNAGMGAPIAATSISPVLPPEIAASGPEVVEKILRSWHLELDGMVSLTVPAGIGDMDALRSLNHCFRSRHQDSVRDAVSAGDFDWYSRTASVALRDVSQPRIVRVLPIVPGTRGLSRDPQANLLSSEGLRFAEPIEQALVAAAFACKTDGRDVFQDLWARGSLAGHALTVSRITGTRVCTSYDDGAYSNVAASGALNADSQRISPTAQAALESGAGV